VGCLARLCRICFPRLTENMPVINSAEDFKALVLSWLHGDFDPDFSDDEMADWNHNESEKWMSFEEWESFCMQNDMA
jgi:hypothetical protein